MFSATMTKDVEVLINDYFNSPKLVSVAVSGSVSPYLIQRGYVVANFYTKINLLAELLKKDDLKKYWSL